MCYVGSMDEVMFVSGRSFNGTGTQVSNFSSDNPTLEEAFRVFCTVYMPSRNFTQQTRRDYRHDLTEWLSQVAVTSVKSISTLSIQRYVSHLDERDLKGANRHRKIAAIKTFLRFLEA